MSFSLKNEVVCISGTVDRLFSICLFNPDRYRCVLYLGGCHLAGERAPADEVVELLVVAVAADRLARDIGWADCFVGFLRAGGFRFECAGVAVFNTVEPLDVIGASGNCLF